MDRYSGKNSLITYALNFNEYWLQRDEYLRQQYTSSLIEMKNKYDSSLNVIIAKFDTSNFKTVGLISNILGNYGYMLDTTNQWLKKISSENIKNEILEWDKKDERINNVYRLSKRLLQNSFPYGYKIFATNPKVFTAENDTIFSNLLAGDINQYVYFNHINKTITIVVSENIIERKRFIISDNVFKHSGPMPRLGEFVKLNGIVSSTRTLYFMLLDDALNDEIFVLGYRETRPRMQ